MSHMRIFTARLAAAGLLAGSLVAPATVAAEPELTGTLVGVVTCGLGERDVPADRAQVFIEGIDLTARTTDGGRFTLVGVPAMHVLTVEAIGDAGAPPGARSDITVEPGETLNIGTIDLSICPNPAPEDLIPPEPMQDDNRD